MGVCVAAPGQPPQKPPGREARSPFGLSLVYRGAQGTRGGVTSGVGSPPVGLVFLGAPRAGRGAAPVAGAGAAAEAAL